jgi:hypothetical protein
MWDRGSRIRQNPSSARNTLEASPDLPSPAQYRSKLVDNSSATAQIGQSRADPNGFGMHRQVYLAAFAKGAAGAGAGCTYFDGSA